ncbi:MAG TPA: hypothetical protein VGH19_06825 [Verrucomicrobiae bacterium]
MKKSLLINWSPRLNLGYAEPHCTGNCTHFEIDIHLSIPGVDDMGCTFELLSGSTFIDARTMEGVDYPVRIQSSRKRLILGKSKRKIRYTSYGAGGNYYWESWTILKKDFPHLLNLLRHTKGFDIEARDDDFYRDIWKRVQTLDRQKVAAFVSHLGLNHLKDLATSHHCTPRELLTA